MTEDKFANTTIEMLSKKDMMEIINIYERALFQIAYQNDSFEMRNRINFRNTFDNLEYRIEKEDMKKIASKAIDSSEAILAKY